MPTTFHQARLAYLHHLENQGKSPRTRYTYGKDLEQIVAFWGSEKPITHLSLPLIGKFLKSPELRLLADGSPRADRTVQKTIRVLRMLIEFCIEQGWLNPILLPKTIKLGRSKVFQDKLVSPSSEL